MPRQPSHDPGVEAMKPHTAHAVIAVMAVVIALLSWALI
jgi:hypothetical protein